VLGAVLAAEGAVERLDDRQLFLPGLRGPAVPLRDEVLGHELAALFPAGRVRDGGGDDGGLEVGAGWAERAGDLLVGQPFGQLGRGDPGEEFGDGDAQGER
jgi:hypothetical protein